MQRKTAKRQNRFQTLVKENDRNKNICFFLLLQSRKKTNYQKAKFFPRKMYTKSLNFLPNPKYLSETSSNCIPPGKEKKNSCEMEATWKLGFEETDLVQFTKEQNSPKNYATTVILLEQNSELHPTYLHYHTSACLCVHEEDDDSDTSPLGECVLGKDTLT